MLTIAFFIGAVVIFYIFKLLKSQNLEEVCASSNMSEQPDQARSSSESDNFEKIDSDDVRNGEGEVDFVVGDESGDSPEPEDGPAHEGRDQFPNAPPPNLRRVLTPAQQLALAEKRSKLR